MFKLNVSSGYQEINAWLLKATCVFWLIAKLLGWRMFTAYRLFPTAPVFEMLDRVPVVIHTALFALSVFFLVLLFFKKNGKYLLPALLLTEILSCLLDQNRWQPWEYQYVFIIFIFIVNAREQSLITVAFTFILIATYIYSGLGKLNEGFLQTIWTRMLLEQFFKIAPHAAWRPWLHYCGYFVGLIEIACGVGLAFLRTRKISATILISMHLFILILLGPFGLKYNKIVWPWNVAMIVYLYLIFLRKQPETVSLKPITTGWTRLVLICWGLLPAFSFFGCWDTYLSSGIYSGKLPGMLVCVSDTGKCRQLQKYSRKDQTNSCNGETVIDIQYWAMAETNMAPYPELRVYKKISEKLKKEYPDAGLNFYYIEPAKYLKRF